MALCGIWSIGASEGTKKAIYARFEFFLLRYGWERNVDVPDTRRTRQPKQKQIHRYTHGDTLDGGSSAESDAQSEMVCE